ncbi:Mg chelatase-like protein [Tersicoccus phoenicis]|uniref:Mg chelatase-like protein n=1 Tax=Tersicoccus phoenicis TaxID=554083 RepID=A0A1R1LBU8_9MICC|nr:YifB family Mg chelatase-like AAA ATPase [Tersicoccus phoenicis]OMH24999.1 Mg chelatase-like protein [Tersicoccus phoenicis]
MPLGRAYAIALIGLNGHVVEVEADIGQTLPNFVLLGLPDSSLHEARERIRSAAQNTGLPLSRRKLTVNLIPATLPKSGSGFDLAICLAALRAAGDVHDTGRTVFLAELGLDGRLRAVTGILPAVMAAVAAGFPTVVVARGNEHEAALVPGADVLAFNTLAQVALYYGADGQRLALEDQPEPEGSPPAAPEAGPVRDLSEVAGQADARFGLEVAAAGAHHLLMVGPPGAGKTMLAERLPTILPPLTDAEAMEVTAIHSLAGRGAPRLDLIRRPPYEHPHHTATVVSVVGGGSGMPRPGAATRAHRGVLFLDEAPEFDRRVLDALREPLEGGRLVVHRAGGAADYPARFQLVLAANPCPCGQDGVKGAQCRCTSLERRRYATRLSAPVLDRVDVRLEVPRVSLREMNTREETESSARVAARVAVARAVQRARLGAYGVSTNAEVGSRVLRGPLHPGRAATKELELAMERSLMTARGHDRVLRLAWTLADLAGHTVPDGDDVGQALMFRERRAVA